MTLSDMILVGITLLISYIVGVILVHSAVLNIFHLINFMVLFHSLIDESPRNMIKQYRLFLNGFN